ncbi:hypothetical protein GBAR_LOCUS21183 [Geodia barretti]|uniref:Uncharacterized protein n=1 Tax=Geodia barretti TaxID=519541 RepID=A0AA35WYU4_GEOBA|nr:hypothetical protein GBAR_LOCUS21183 [Geodia barretti]
MAMSTSSLFPGNDRLRLPSQSIFPTYTSLGLASGGVDLRSWLQRPGGIHLHFGCSKCVVRMKTISHFFAVLHIF